MINLHRIVVGCPSQENNNHFNDNPPVPIPHIRNTPLKALLRTPTPPTVQKKIQSNQSPSGPVYTKKKQSILGFTRLFDLNMKIHFKTTRGKGLRIPSRTTAGGSSPFPLSVPEVDVALSRFRPSLLGPRRRPRRPLETKRSPRVSRRRHRRRKVSAVCSSARTLQVKTSRHLEVVQVSQIVVQKLPPSCHDASSLRARTSLRSSSPGGDFPLRRVFP